MSVGIAPLTTRKQKVVLLFDFQFASPDTEPIFKQSGGRLDSASTPLFNAFHVSGNSEAVRTLSDVKTDLTRPHSVAMVVEDAFVAEDGNVVIPAPTRLGALFMTKSFTLNGSIGSTVLGETNVLLMNLLNNGGNGLYPLLYDSAWASARAHLSIFNARVGVTKSGDSAASRLVSNVSFRSDARFMQAVDRVERHIRGIMSEAVAIRQTDLIYPKQKALMKPVSAAVGGLAGSGYVPLGSMLNHGVSMTDEAINAAVDFALRLEVGDDDNAVDHLLENVLSNDMDKIAEEAIDMLSTMSTVVSMHMSYRVDGAVSIAPTGAQFVPAEKWSRAAQQWPGVEGDDCDRTATMLYNMAVRVQSLSAETRTKYKALGALAAVLDHYDASLVVLGARSSEASAEHGRKETVAGHAITLLQPKDDVVRAVLEGAARKGNPIADAAGGVSAYTERLWRTFYPPELLATFQPDLAAQLGKPFSEQVPSSLPVAALEGTTPSSALLYEKDANTRKEMYDEAHSVKDGAHILGENAFRMLRVLAASGKNPDSHGFYHDLVESTRSDQHPLWIDTELRAMAGSAHQWTLVSNARDGMSTAGATPKEMATRSYQMIPVAMSNASRAEDLDVLSAAAARDVFPPSLRPLRLGAEASAIYKSNIDAIKKFADTKIAARGSTSPITFVAAANALIFNNKFVQRSLEKFGVHEHRVMKRDIPGLIHDHEGNDAGIMIAVTVSV